VQVEIWSDVVCPWCYIGKRRFEEALRRVAAAGDLDVTIDVVYRPYQLDPRAAPGVATPAAEAYARKFGGPEAAARVIDHITAVAAEDGLELHLERARRANTLDAHRLLWLAEQPGSGVDQAALKERLLAAYFTEGRHVGDRDELADVAAAVGMDREHARAFLDGEEGLGQVREQLARAAAMGIDAVPTYVFDGRWTVPGAQDPEVFEMVIRRVLAKQAEAAAEEAARSGAVCVDDTCEI
jgi:predicted DsbA family dithiol-disulfide isomerase